MALPPSMYQSFAQPRYGEPMMYDERMMYDGAPIMADGYGLLGSDMAAPAAAPVAAPTGFQFMTDRGRQAGYGTNKSGFIAADPNAQYRMYDERGKNKIVAEGTGVDALQNIYTLANQFNKDQGKKANWGIERLNPETGKWERVAENDPAKNIVGKIADVALPIAASFIPSVGPVLGAALGSAASSVAQGRSLENTLLRAGLSAASAGVVGATGVDKALGGVLGGVAQAGGQAGGQAAGQAAGQAVGDIVVTGLSKGLQAAGGALGQAALSQAGNAASRALSGYQTPAEQFAQQPLPEAFQPPVDIYAGLDPINVIGNRVVPNYGGALSGVFEPIATEFLPKSVLPEPLPSEPAPVDDTIVVTGTLPTVTPSPIPGFETAIPAIVPGALTAAQTGGTPPPSENGGVLGTGLTLPQLLSIGGIGADLLQNLLGGSGGGGAGVPYVSPFGTGAGFAPRQDMRANPNIIDYERYGFGPEAMFFQPEYSGLLPANAPAPQAQPAMTINPALMPLI